MPVDYAVTEESFASLSAYWQREIDLVWGSIFVLPAWLQVWWQSFGEGFQLYLRAVRQGERVIGIAPLMVKGKTAFIVGGGDVCDYLDFVVDPRRQKGFFSALLDDLRINGIERLELGPLRPDSIVFTGLAGIARGRGHDVICHEDGVSVEMDLPASWDEYLLMLTRKQRHEVKRKLRRLWEAGEVDYRFPEIDGNVGGLVNLFLKLFSCSQEEKANFMTARMESFFTSLAEAMAEVNLLRFGILELNKSPVAMIIGFDYNDTMYLYNSAYDPDYSHLSVGLLSKVLCIKESIKMNRKKWDFLKGGEPYKYRIGGKEIPLYSCRVTIR